MAATEDMIDLVVPEPVRQVCQELVDAGFEAYTVGGAVRDAILGRRPGDWDVTTSATPDQVVDIFDKTIPTGIQHGTVTVMVGRGASREAVEVTTFRGEGAYTDARRPDHVVFGVPLEEDLARRDFVINAMAFDPIAKRLADPFGGHSDLERRVVRAVGDASERFTEDGLRIMRAVRFVAVLDFELAPATEAAIRGALPSLAKVSQERNRVELFKLLSGRAMVKGLEIAKKTGVIELVVPELEGVDWSSALRRTEALEPDPLRRLGSLLIDIADAAAVDSALRRLKLSNADRSRVERITALGRAYRGANTGPTVRRVLGRVGTKHAGDILAVWGSELETNGDADDLAVALGFAAEALDKGYALSVGELSVTGGDLMQELAVEKGPLVGETLRALLEKVYDDPSLDSRDKLLDVARVLISASR
jgi:tRNA nucleotidyltransferase (CCA-adding enzyme)